MKILGMISGHAGTGKDHLAMRYAHTRHGWSTIALSTGLLRLLDGVLASVEAELDIEDPDRQQLADTLAHNYPLKNRTRPLLQELGEFSVQFFGRDVLARLSVGAIENALAAPHAKGVWVTGVRRAEEVRFLQSWAVANEVKPLVMAIGKPFKATPHAAEAGIDEVMTSADLTLSSGVVGRVGEELVAMMGEVDSWINNSTRQTEMNYGKVETKRRAQRQTLARNNS